LSGSSGTSGTSGSSGSAGSSGTSGSSGQTGSSGTSGSSGSSGVSGTIFTTNFITLIDAATISWTYSLGFNAKVQLTGQNRTIEINGATSGDYGTLFIYQDATTASRVNFPTSINKFASGTYSFSGTSSVDIFTFVREGNNFFWNFNKNFY
jgi:hypothetical protein